MNNPRRVKAVAPWEGFALHSFYINNNSNSFNYFPFHRLHKHTTLRLFPTLFEALLCNELLTSLETGRYSSHTHQSASDLPHTPTFSATCLHS
jgi:hypothetical protein